LVQVLFSQRNVPQIVRAIPGIEASTFELGCKSTMDLYVSFADTPNGFGCIWIYNTDLFDAATIHAMASLYRVILEETSANPGVRLNELRSLLTKTERQKSEAGRRGFSQAAPETLRTTEHANQLQSELSFREAEPAHPAPF